MEPPWKGKLPLRPLPPPLPKRESGAPSTNASTTPTTRPPPLPSIALIHEEGDAFFREEIVVVDEVLVVRESRPPTPSQAPGQHTTALRPPALPTGLDSGEASGLTQGQVLDLINAAREEVLTLSARKSAEMQQMLDKRSEQTKALRVLIHQVLKRWKEIHPDDPDLTSALDEAWEILNH